VGRAKVADDPEGLWKYMIAWEFRPKSGAERCFEEAYAPHGIWAVFFKPCEGFIATELNRDLNDPGRYLTLDLWVSRATYEKFRADHAAEYRAIDAQCEALTEHEAEVGRFERLGF
jgi:heme-degrading monooxygenase HmoA